MTAHSVPTSRPAPTLAPVAIVAGIAMIAAPLFTLASTVAWHADADRARAILEMWGFIGFGLAAVAFAIRIGTKAPVGAAIVLLLGIVGVCAGQAFTTEMVVVHQFGIEKLIHEAPMFTIVFLYAPGAAFPLFLLVAAFFLWRTSTTLPQLAFALALGAVIYPISRLPEFPTLATVGDVLLCLALVPLGLSVVRDRA